MNLAALAERFDWPDALLRFGIAALCARTDRAMRAAPANATADFARAMSGPIAVSVDAANTQHYEVPASFFGLVLGPRRKYSSCLYPSASTTLAEAEEFALAETAAHADLHDGQSVLELGCGWGSLSLWMAERYPASRIVSVSNSASQRAFIEQQASERGLTNLRVVTSDMNMFVPDDGPFDRVVSVEMFEHMSNWRALLSRVREWLKPDGVLFVHIFTHATTPYRFDHADKGDWIAQHFFTGGIMPSHALIREFPDLFTVEQEWRWNGSHYSRTATDWLTNSSTKSTETAQVLQQIYGNDAALWGRRWRLFFLATEGLFGYDGGNAWGVSHYRLRPASR